MLCVFSIMTKIVGISQASSLLSWLRAFSCLSNLAFFVLRGKIETKTSVTESLSGINHTHFLTL